MSDTLPFSIRQAEPEDVAKIVQNWRRGVQMFSYDLMPLCEEAISREMTKKMAIILKLTTMDRLKVAYNEEYDIILGFVAYEPDYRKDGYPVLHWVYTTDGFRHNGVATALLRECGLFDEKRLWLTHYTYRIKRLLKKARQKWWVDPNIIQEILNVREEASHTESL